MLAGWVEVAGGEQVLPHVRLFHGSPSEDMWEDENGTTQIIPQGEGGEQGDALMPLLFAVGQHAALVAAQGRLQQDQLIFAFLDYIYTTSDPDRVPVAFGSTLKKPKCGIKEG